MDNTSKYYQSLTDIQVKTCELTAPKMFMIMRDLVDEAEQFQSKEIAELKAKVAELHELAYLTDQRNDQGEGQATTYKEAYESAGPTLTQVRSIGADAIRKIEELVHDGNIKVKVGDTGYNCEWRDAGEWLLEQSVQLKKGE